MWGFADLNGNIATWRTDTSDGLSLLHRRFDETRNVTFTSLTGSGTNGQAALSRAPVVWRGLTRDADTGLRLCEGRG